METFLFSFGNTVFPSNE